MKHTLQFLFVVLLATATAHGQAITKISGFIKDNSGKGIPAANVMMLNTKDSSLVKADISDDNGHYELQLANGGTFVARYSSMGFEQVMKGNVVVKEGQDNQLADVIMRTSGAQLKEVTVTVKKPLFEVKADKVVFNVENSINATGSNAMELLQKSPGVTVDNNDNISMKGKTGVKIYVDGKMTQLDTKDLAAYLRGINSNDVEAIEMISNPSAKYDAAGNAGIVNIRLKKNKKYGTNGSVTAGLVQGVTLKENGSVNLNYRDSKVNVFGNVSANNGINRNTLNLYRTQRDTLYDQHSVNNNRDKSANAKAGADFFLNSKNTLGVLATASMGNKEWKSSSNTVIYNPDGSFAKTLNALNTVPGKRSNANFNINYRYADTNGREINVDADYGFFRGTGHSYQPNFYMGTGMDTLYSIINKNSTPTNIDIYTIKADAEQKLGKGKLGYGAKMAYVTTANSLSFYNVDHGNDVLVTSRSNSFAYTENVNAAYLNYQRQLNEKWSLQAGLRAENTNSKGELTRADGMVQPDNSVTRSYTDLFPSAALSWNISKSHALNLTYSRRIDRPTYQDLNPFENKLDELTYEKGNAFLRPQYTNTLELTHTFMGFINTTAGYSKVNDYATQVTDTIGNASYVQQRNLATQQILSFSIGAATPFKKWWSGYISIWYSYQMFEGSIGANKLSLNIPLYGAYAQQSFTLGKGFSAEISGWYNGPGLWGGTWRTSSQGSLDVGAQKLLLKDRASVKLSFTDLFYTAPWHSVNNFGGVNVVGNGSWESQTARVSFTYRFGSSTVKKARDRETGLESEKSRIKGK